MRERGYPAPAIRRFCQDIGVAKSNSLVESAFLEHCVRDYLNPIVQRVMVIKNPIKVILDNYNQEEVLYLPNNPMDQEMGKREVTFSNEIYIDESDFSDNPPPKFFRLKPGGMVRLVGAYIIQYVSHEVIDGQTVVHATIIEDSKEGGANAGIKVKGTIHWVNAKDSLDVTLFEYDYLLDDQDDGRDFSLRIQKDTKKVYHGKAEAFLKDTKPYTHYQFMRTGYYMTERASTEGDLRFNLVVGLKDSYKK